MPSFSLQERSTGMLWRTYSRFYDGLLRFWPYVNLIDLVVKRAELEPGMKVLDLGCGTGNVLERMIGVVDLRATGVDLTKAMLDVAAQKLDQRIAVGAVELVHEDALMFLRSQSDASFDRIVSVNLLYAITDLDAICAEMVRVIRPNGRIVISTSVDRHNLPIIKEHLVNASPVRLLDPRLLAVFVVDCIIGVLGLRHTFPFWSEDRYRQAMTSAGATFRSSERCYGGKVHGVNILFTAEPS